MYIINWITNAKYERLFSFDQSRLFDGGHVQEELGYTLQSVVHRSI